MRFFLFLKLILVAVFVITWACPSLRAQQSDTTRFVAETLHITSTPLRLDSTSTGVSRVRLAPTQWFSARNTQLDDIFRLVPGVISSDRANLSVGDRISIRGSGWQSAFGIRGIRLFYEGLPLTTVDGQTMTELIDMQRIESFTVQQGASASLFGNSSGGAIFMESTFRPQLQAGFRLGSFGLLSAETDVSFSGSNRISQRISFSTTQQRGFRTHSEAVITRLGISQLYRLSDSWSWNNQFYFVHAPMLNNPGSLTLQESIDDVRSSNPANVRQQAGKAVTHLAYQSRFSHTKGATFSVFGQYRTLTNPLAFAWIDLERFYTGIMADKPLSSGNVGDVGLHADVLFQSDNRKNFGNSLGDKTDLRVNQQEQLFSTGVGLRHQKQWESGMRLENAIRSDALFFQLHDRFRSDGDESGSRLFLVPGWSSTLSYDWNSTRVFIGVRTSFDSPTTTELTNRPDGNAGFNPDLKAETQFQTEIGVKRSSNSRFSWQLTGYINQLSDIKLAKESETQVGRTVYFNSGYATLYGLEGYVEYSILNHRTIFNGTALKSRLRPDNQGSFSIPGLPEYSAVLLHEIQFHKFTLTADLRLTGRSFANTVNTQHAQAWQTFSVQVLYAFSNWNTFFRIGNIFNTMYYGSVSVNATAGRYYEPAPLRTILFGIRYHVFPT